MCLLLARWFLVILFMQLRVPDIGFGRRMNFRILRGNSSRRNPTCDSWRSCVASILRWQIIGFLGRTRAAHSRSARPPPRSPQLRKAN